MAAAAAAARRRARSGATWLTAGDPAAGAAIGRGEERDQEPGHASADGQKVSRRHQVPEAPLNEPPPGLGA